MLFLRSLNAANMSFNAIRENNILAKISEFTVIGNIGNSLLSLICDVTGSVTFNALDGVHDAFVDTDDEVWPEGCFVDGVVTADVVVGIGGIRTVVFS